MKAKNISERAILKAHCDYVKEQMTEVKALLQHNDSTIQLNKQRALADIETAMSSLKNLQIYFKQV